MRILAISDWESPYLWDYFTPDKLDGVELILSCGDLEPQYLSFLATYTHAPVLYVHGNHDGCYTTFPPDGCICIEDQIFLHNGLRILGLGGSMRYKDGAHQYTQRQMHGRIRHLWPRLLLKGGIDILLTHSPAFGIGDGSDLPHQGFQAFNKLLDRYHPICFVHGHMHMNYGCNIRREIIYQNTRIINASGHYFFDL